MKNWHPDTDLDRLLAALGEEIVDMSDEDMRALCGQAGPPLSGIARDMRARIATINDGEVEPIRAVTDIGLRPELGVRSH